MNKRGRANITGGDDLVDDWLVEDVGLDSGSDDGAALLEAWCANPSEADEQKSGDRGATDDANAKEQTEQEKKRKKKQRRKKKKARKSQGKPGAAHDISCASACAQRDFLWTTFKSTVGKDMTEIESGPPPPDSAFVSLPSVPRSTLNFANFIKAAVPSFKRSIMWSRNSKRAPGPPTVIVVCSSARRCVELLKPLAAFKTRVLKLFAKHTKLEQQQNLLASGTVTLAVGTPARIRALIERGSLKVGECHVGKATYPALVVFDMVRDAKTLTLLDRRETVGETMLLYHQHLSRPVDEGRVKLAFF